MPTMKNSFSGCANSTTPCRGTDPQEGWFGSIRGGEGDRCLDDRIQSQQQFPKGGQVRPEASGHDDPVNLGLTGAPGQVALASARGFQPTRHVRNAIGDPAGVRGPAIDRQTVQTEGGLGLVQLPEASITALSVSRCLAPCVSRQTTTKGAALRPCDPILLRSWRTTASTPAFNRRAAALAGWAAKGCSYAVSRSASLQPLAAASQWSAERPLPPRRYCSVRARKAAHGPIRRPRPRPSRRAPARQA